MSQLTVVGKGVERLDAFEKVAGSAKYCVDLELPAMLYGKVKRSPHPHARIISIDTKKAKALRGVVAVITARDLPETRFGVGLNDETVLARDKVRYIGDPVAAVAAETLEIAEEALDLITVKYEKLPAVFDPEEAMKPDCPAVIQPDFWKYKIIPVGGCSPKLLKELGRPNVLNYFRIRKGNVEDGFKEADIIVENRYSTPALAHCCLEPHNCIADVDAKGNVTVWASTQVAYIVLNEISEALNIPPSKIRVIIPHVGGGFGTKLEVKPEPICVALALHARRPVKLVYTRQEQFSCTCFGHSIITYLKDGVTKDGTLVAREVKLILDTGAYSGWGQLKTKNAAFGLAGVYKVPNFKLDSYGVYTNNPVASSMRGFGAKQTIWAVETQMDIIAKKLGMDPVQFRLKNILNEGDVNVMGHTMHSVGIRECLLKAADALGWGKPLEKSVGPWRRGRGIAIGNKYSMLPTASCVFVKIHDDEAIEIRTSATEIGQGTHTILAQIAAEEFMVPLEKIKISPVDTAITPFDHGATSSRQAFAAGNAVKMACQDAKKQIFEKSAKKLGARVDELETKNSVIYVKSAPEKAIRIRELFTPMALAGMFLDEGGEFLGKATFYNYGSPMNPETGQAEKTCAFFTYTTQGAEVEVDIETGAVRLLKLVDFVDCGKAINPAIVQGQADGGMAMGLGMGLTEQVILKDGLMINDNFADYKTLTACDLPSINQTISGIVETPHRDGPYGAKGVGEGTNTAPPAAIGNAIYDAVGVRFFDLPLTPERILNGLKKRGGKKSHA